MNELAKALVEAQKTMPTVHKDGKSHHGAYVTLGNLINTTKPHLAEHGLAIVQFPAVGELGQPMLLTQLIHESGEQIEYSMPLFLTQQNMQQFGASLTYARRYSWSAVLGISDEDDDDGNRASQQPAKKTAPADAGAHKSAGTPSAGVTAGAATVGDQAAPASSPFVFDKGAAASDAQKKKLYAMLGKLSKGDSPAISERQFVAAAHGLGVTGDDSHACIESLSKGAASNLIERLSKLEANQKAAA